MQERKIVDRYIVRNRRIKRTASGAVRVTADVWHLGELVHRYEAGGIRLGITNEELNEQIVRAAIQAEEMTRRQRERDIALEQTLQILKAEVDEFEVPIYEELEEEIVSEGEGVPVDVITDVTPETTSTKVAEATLVDVQEGV